MKHPYKILEKGFIDREGEKQRVDKEVNLYMQKMHFGVPGDYFIASRKRLQKESCLHGNLGKHFVKGQLRTTDILLT